MNEEEIVVQLITELDAATPSDFDVRTVGGDQEVTPPDVILDWSVTRLEDANGHKSTGGFLTDGSGNKTAVEHHTYWEFSGDCTIRVYSEQRRDELLRSVQDAFIVYEGSPGEFDRDTREWEITSAGPRENSMIEPDWYEAGVTVSFEYVRRTEGKQRDHIEEINTSTEVDESLELTITDTK